MSILFSIPIDNDDITILPPGYADTETDYADTEAGNAQPTATSSDGLRQVVDPQPSPQTKIIGSATLPATFKKEARKAGNIDGQQLPDRSAHSIIAVAQTVSASSKPLISDSLLTPSLSTLHAAGRSGSKSPVVGDQLLPRPLRSAPPKCLAPPISTKAQQQQQQQQLLGRTRKQTSLEDVPLLRDDLKHHRLLLFDECEKTQKRLHKLLVDSKAENLSVQGDEKFEKVVVFNKQLRQFKRIHDRNKVLCQDSLPEQSSEEEAGVA